MEKDREWLETLRELCQESLENAARAAKWQLSEVERLAARLAEVEAELEAVP